MPWVGCGGICVGVHGRDELSYAKNLRLPSHILFTATVWSCKEMPVCRVKGCACETSGGVHHRCCVCLCVGGFVSYVIAFYLGCCVLLLNVSLSVCVCVVACCSSLVVLLRKKSNCVESDSQQRRFARSWGFPVCLCCLWAKASTSASAQVPL